MTVNEMKTKPDTIMILTIKMTIKAITKITVIMLIAKKITIIITIPL